MKVLLTGFMPFGKSTINPSYEAVKLVPDEILGAERFKNKLEKSGINVTIRREMGSDIDGACGQLRRRYAEEQ